MGCYPTCVTSEVVGSQVDEEEAGHQVKQFQGFNTGINTNDEHLSSEADFTQRFKVQKNARPRLAV